MTRNRPEKVRQHTVPKRYLKGFTLRGDQLMQYDRETGKSVTVNVTNASVVKRIYSLQGRDGQWDDSIEDYFMALEEDAFPRFEKLAQGDVPSERDKGIMALHIARQMQRGRFLAAFAQQEAAKFNDYAFTLSVLETSRAEIVAKHGEANYEKALAALKETKQGVKVDPKTYLRFIMPTTPPYVGVIANLDWRIETAKSGYFATSDNPVCVRRRGQPVNPHVVGVADADAELYFPLNKTTILIASPLPSRQLPRKVGAPRVRELNRITVIGAFHFVFAPQSDPAVASFMTEHVNDRIRFGELNWDGDSE